MTTAGAPTTEGVQAPPWRQVLAVSALGLLCFLRVIPSAFVLDDDAAIVRNPVVNGAVPWWEAFGRDFWGVPPGHEPGTYRPFTVLSFRLDWLLSGGNPHFFHAVNVVLHAVVVGLTFVVFRRLVSNRIAWIAAAGLAVFAASGEAVQSIVGRADLLVTAAILVGLAAHRRLGAPWAAVAASCYAFALGTKESGILAVVAWLCLDWFKPAAEAPLRQRRGRLLLYAPVLGAYFVLRHRLTQSWGVSGAHDGMMNPLALASVGGRALGAGRIFVEKYLAGFVNPAHRLYACSGLGGRPSRASEPIAWLGVVLLLAICVTPFLLRRRAPSAAIGAGWFALFFIPVSNLIVPSVSMYAERLLYLPMIGVGILLGAGAEALARRAPKPVLAWALVGALLVANFAAVQLRNLDWRTAEGLYLSDLETGSDCAIVQANAAATWYQRRDPVRAEAFSRTALDLYQPYPFALSILASSLDRQGKTEEAEQQFQTALRQTTAWEVAADYARFLARHQRWDEGIRLLEQRQQRDPLNDEVRKLLAQLRQQRDRTHPGGTPQSP